MGPSASPALESVFSLPWAVGIVSLSQSLYSLSVYSLLFWTDTLLFSSVDVVVVRKKPNTTLEANACSSLCYKTRMFVHPLICRQ